MVTGNKNKILLIYNVYRWPKLFQLKYEYLCYNFFHFGYNYIYRKANNIKKGGENKAKEVDIHKNIASSVMSSFRVAI